MGPAPSVKQMAPQPRWSWDRVGMLTFGMPFQLSFRFIAGP